MEFVAICPAVIEFAAKFTVVIALAAIAFVVIDPACNAPAYIEFAANNTDVIEFAANTFALIDPACNAPA